MTWSTSALRTLALCTFAMCFALGIGLLVLAAEFTTDIPNHHSATACVYASCVLCGVALVGLVAFVGIPEPRCARLPAAHVIER
jgi:hypothetical protein